MTSVVLSTGQNCVEAGGNQGVFFTPANAMPMDIQDVKAKPSTAPISVPFAVARGKKAPRKNMPDSGPLKDASNVPVICVNGPPIIATNIAIPLDAAPKNTTVILAMMVALTSEMLPTQGLMRSAHTMADRLLSPVDRVLSEALNREARNRPGIPGKPSNMFITV